jgi:hypothetical protein
VITTKELPSYDRPIGRKAGDLDVNFAVDGTHHRATFPFRVDDAKGQFIAVDGDVQYISETKAELIEHMKKIAAAKISLTWTRYIEIDYTVGIVQGEHRRGHSGLGPDADREGPVVSISLDFEVVEYSNKFTPPGRSPGLSRRKIGDNGKPYDEERRYDVPDDAIPFSQERLDALKHIQAAMTAIDDRMRALFVGKPKAIAARLDTITNQQLALPAPDAAEVPNIFDGEQKKPAVNGKRARKGDRR